jgi:hypothetical protein
VIEQRQLERFRALIEDIAYTGKSHQEIAAIYGLTLDGIAQFSTTWAELIHMARWNRYRELQHQLLMGEVEEVLQLITREREMYKKAVAQRCAGKSGQG